MLALSYLHTTGGCAGSQVHILLRSETPVYACCRVSRLPGLPSSHLGLQSMTGELDEFGFEAYLGLPEHSEVSGPDMHSVMESKLNMKTPPVNRAIL